jgi:hypothetical protein
MKISRKLLFASLFSFAIVSSWACVAAIPVIIYHQATKMQTATVQVNADANNVYQTARRLIQERTDIEILKQEDDKRTIEIKKAEKYASIKATPLDGGKTQLVVTADADTEEKEKEEDKELALKIVTAICDELGVSYSVARE